MRTTDVSRTAPPEGIGGFVPMDGPGEDLVRDLSAGHAEPDWMLRQRLRGRDRLRSEGIPSWASFLRDVDLEGMVRSESPASSGSRDTADAALMPGFSALEASEEAYRNIRQDLAARGIRFMGLRGALSTMPDLVKTHFGSVVTADDGPFAALNTSLWTGGSFLYVPPGVTAEVPLQAEIREDYAGVEPFERHLIVADRGADLTYIEGCTAPVYTPDQLHVSAIELVAMPGSHVRYIALQNFSKEVDNLVTKHAQVHERASIEWVDVNLGSRRAWKVPRADLVGPGASAEFVGFSLVGSGQDANVGADMMHLAPRTRSRIRNHAVVHAGGRVALRSGVRVATDATAVSSAIEWSSLMLDADSRAQTVPVIEVDEADAEITQSGTVRRIGEEMLFYMSSRGVAEAEAKRMVVLGIAGMAAKRIPVEYAVEVDRLIEMELGGGIG